jgi:hypothetical protein
MAAAAWRPKQLDYSWLRGSMNALPKLPGLAG